MAIGTTTIFLPSPTFRRPRQAKKAEIVANKQTWLHRLEARYQFFSVHNIIFYDPSWAVCSWAQAAVLQAFSVSAAPAVSHSSGADSPHPALPPSW